MTVYPPQITDCTDDNSECVDFEDVEDESGRVMLDKDI